MLNQGQGHSQPQIFQLQSQQQPTKQGFKVAVICGSLRKASTNAGLIKAIYEAKDQRFFFQWIQIINFPVFNEDIEAVGIPTDVQAARQAVGKADAILFAIPQYNGTIASSLKNAYDWLSRADKDNFCPVTQKIGAMVSSAGNTGGVAAQQHFRIAAEYRKLNILKPSKEAQIIVKRFNGKVFDDNGKLVNADINKKVPLFLNQFYNHIKQNKK